MYAYILNILSGLAINSKPTLEIAQLILQFLLYKQPSFLSFLIFETDNKQWVGYCY